MAAITRYAFALSSLSFLSSVRAVPFPGNDDTCVRTTTTVYTTVTVGEGWEQTTSVANAAAASTATTSAAEGSWAATDSVEAVTQQYTPPSDFTYPGVTFPTFSPSSLNPNGPFYNPNDFIPYYVDWPGKPSSGASTPPPLPTKAPKPSGGYSASEYKSPAWQQVGKDLTPGLSQEETNGDSQWGLIDCPRLSSYLGSGYSASSSKSGSGSYYTSAVSSSYVSGVHYTSAAYSAYPTYSASSNGTKSTTSFSLVTSSSSSSASPSSSAPSCSANNTAAFCASKMPDTGVTRTYEFTVAYATIAPDGVQKNGLVVNNQFPGPLIEANWGDWIQVTVTNDLPEYSQEQGEGTSLHWHGFLQQETPYYDGVPSVQQCPIAPGKSVTYTYRADHIGTSWYHSHYSSQYAGGALGPVVVHGPQIPGACYDEDLGPVFINDWYHADYYSLVETTMAGGLPLSDNILINGKMNYPCDNTTAVCTANAGISKFQFTPGKKYRMRLINPSAEAILKFHIDGHNLTVIANDFVPIVPYTTNVVTVGVGQRSDIIVEATGSAGDSYWMRATGGNALAGTGCALTSGVVTEGVAAVYYDGADTDSEPTSTSDATSDQLLRCQNDDLSLTRALCPIALDDDADVFTQTITMEFASNGTNFVWFMNNSTFHADYNVNLLDQIIGGNTTFESDWNVYTFDSSKSSIRIIFENTFAFPHPMHLHGHDFNVLADGVGTWDGTIVNPSDTQARDVHYLPGATSDGNGYAVIQFKMDNPGLWPLHCHIAWHVSAGLYVNILERPDAITYQVPSALEQTCVDWAAWEAAGNVPDQIDSGL
ncbi:uncharacterized protein PV09_01768 [Verruconis gallopava]|uniref:Multicopper oxidase n=1 Tax=Verruconis gallopava TaxID=253628 RepID=A0A0D2AM63_9PEZI|nr:uncharacterized protein PV09_01768 [Verruconis gallopava]KIW07853.1 hypothetical protein PV09_01768 [Verruconis gallopava]